MGRGAFGEHGAVAKLHGCAGGQHRVGDDEHLAVDAGRGEVFDEHVEVVLFLAVLAVGRHEGVLRAVEVVEEALVERQPRAEDGGEHHLVGDVRARGGGQRCGHFHIIIM